MTSGLPPLDADQTEPAASKSELRALLRARRLRLHPNEKERASREIVRKLTRLDEYRRARMVHTYVAWRDEVNNHDLIRSMLSEGRRVAVPKVDKANHRLDHYFIERFDSLRPGAFGILEPAVEEGSPPTAPLELFDLILVPGVAFDRRGNRLGYGAGYYDRFLERVPAPKIGLSFSSQIVSHIPAEAHDRCVDIIVTEEEVIRCEEERRGSSF